MSAVAAEAAWYTQQQRVAVHPAGLVLSQPTMAFADSFADRHAIGGLQAASPAEQKADEPNVHLDTRLDVAAS